MGVRMKSSPKNIYQSIKNTLILLTDNDLTIFHNDPLYQKSRNDVKITWPNHNPGRHNCNSSFGYVAQYKTIIKTGAYTCLLFDGTIVRVSYSFNNNSLTDHSLLWWPSPFKINSDDLEMGGVLEIFDLYANSEDWHEQIQMRSPIRFDYDKEKGTNEHPVSHLHLQTSDCRLYIDRPICFNRFIKFIFQSFYPDIYKNYSFWNDLWEISFDEKELLSPVENQVYLGWYQKAN